MIQISRNPETAIHVKQSCIPLQKARIGFYHSLIKATRLLSGEILVSTSSSDEHDIQAILLWLPPKYRMSITSFSFLYQSGFIGTMLDYGIRGIYRVNFVYEANVELLFKTAGIKSEECAFVQMIAVNPENILQRQGYARNLLQWQMERHWWQLPNIPVCLDTSTEQGVRAYEQLGFSKIGDMPVDTGTDTLGFPATIGSEEWSKGQINCRQRVMVRHNTNNP